MISQVSTGDSDAAWQAVLARDRRADGRFVTGVLSTGIYCRPSCAARHPRRENVRFFTTPAEARACGLRACMRCRPDDVASDEVAIARAIAMIVGGPAQPSLSEMANAAGYSPHHFHRLFRKATGVTPAAFARAVRARRMIEALEEADDVTQAIYAAGYAAPARFYADADRWLGMTPGAWRRGGEGILVRWIVVETDLGELLVATTERGVCRVAFEEAERDLTDRLPNAILEPADRVLASRIEQAVFAARPSSLINLSPDVQAAAFIEIVRAALAGALSGGADHAGS